jgi:putative oxidoreductase
MKALFFKVTKENNIWNELSITVLRLYVGFAMAFGHGLGKIPPSDRLIEGVTGMGFPMPVAFAWAAALAEFLGGILLAVGLLTRPSAFFLGFTMCVAGFVAHAQDPFDRKELALFYAACCLVFLFRGASGLSIDRFFVGKKKK